MKEDQVHSLIREHTDEIEDDDLRSFIKEILAHERPRLDEYGPPFRDRYKSLVDDHVENSSLSDYDTDE